jgi:hypothetical protein
METIENKYEKRHFCGSGPKYWIGWVILGILGVTAFAFLFGAVVMWLWNLLMPAIFHLGVITYWQAVGLAVLARLLFGSFHHGSPHRQGKPKFGPWRNRYRGNQCRDHHGTKWSYYDQYWSEEGEQAFNAYLKRKSENPVKE